jgi:hypothetical protein
MAIDHQASFRNRSPYPNDYYYCQPNSSTPWESVEDAHNGIEAAYRAIGKKFLVGGIEYWYKGGTQLVNLVPFVNSADGFELTDNQEIFSDRILLDRNLNWNVIPGTLTGEALNGGQINIPSRTINIPAGQTGEASKIGLSFPLTGNIRTGDIAKIKVVQLESLQNASSYQNVIISLWANGIEQDIVPEVREIQPKVLEYIFEYEVKTTNSLEVIMSIGEDGDAPTTLTIFTLESIATYFPRDRYSDAVTTVDEILRRAEYMYPFFERAAVISKVDTTNVVDNTERLQDEMDKGVQTSGRLILPAQGTVKITDTLFIKGGLEIKASRSLVLSAALTTVNKELFNVATAKPFRFEDVTLQRSTNLIIQSIKIEPQADIASVNKDSSLERVSFSNFPIGVSLDYCDRFVLNGCNFLYGQRGVAVGALNPSLVGDVAIKHSRFLNVNLNGVESSIGNNLTIDDCYFGTIDAPIYNGANIVIYLMSGEHRNLRILNCVSEACRQYGILMRVFTGATLKDSSIINNHIRDKSTQTNSYVSCIEILADANTVKTLAIDKNKLHNKGFGLNLQNVNSAHIAGNFIEKETGTFPAATAQRIVNSSFLSYGNILEPGQTNADILTNNTIITGV